MLGEAAAPDAASSTFAVGGDTKKARVLFVDDEQILREVVGTTLERSGYRVMTARNGEDALELLHDYPAMDLVITDVVMPNVSGPAVSTIGSASDPAYAPALCSRPPLPHGVCAMGNFSSSSPTATSPPSNACPTTASSNPTRSICRGRTACPAARWSPPRSPSPTRRRRPDMNLFTKLQQRAAEGLPAFDNLVYRFVGATGDTNLAALMTGECDVVDQNTDFYGMFPGLLERETAGKLKTYVGQGPEWEHIDFDIRPAAYDDGYNPAAGDRVDFFVDSATCCCCCCFRFVVRILMTMIVIIDYDKLLYFCLLYTSPSPRDRTRSRMPSSA